jgi:hypothetical protein
VRAIIVMSNRNMMNSTPGRLLVFSGRNQNSKIFQLDLSIRLFGNPQDKATSIFWADWS